MKKSLWASLLQMRKATVSALSFVEGLSLDDFKSDERTQHAVAMTLIIIGEMAGRITKDNPELATAPEFPWHSMTGMRNRIAHGYYDVDLDTVWLTTTERLPELLTAIDGRMATLEPFDPEPRD